jgi:hypothetical protein
MLRRLFTLVCAFSLFLFVATVTCWMWSYWDWRTFACATGKNTENVHVISVGWSNGSLIGMDQRFPLPESPQEFGLSTSTSPISKFSAGNDGWRWTTFRFSFAGIRHGVLAIPGTKTYCFVFPLWLATVLTLVLPTAYVARWHRDVRRQRTALCLTCGYDLHASKGRCPECGTPIHLLNPKASPHSSMKR